MSRQYKKSAKDLAFDRERTKLNSTIQKQEKQIFDLTRELNKANMEIESLKMTIGVLEAALQIPKEELIADIERTKKLSALLKNPFGTIVGEYMGSL